MSHHIVTVCMFCLLCATHSTCGAHISRLGEESEPSVIRFEQSRADSLPFELSVTDFQSRDFAHDDHEIRKKNLSDEKKMRYLQKLSKIRSHRAENVPEQSEVSDDSLGVSMSKIRSAENVLEQSEVSNNALSISLNKIGSHRAENVLEQSEISDDSPSVSLSEIRSHGAEDVSEQSEVSDNLLGDSLSKIRSAENVPEQSEVSDSSLSVSLSKMPSHEADNVPEQSEVSDNSLGVSLTKIRLAEKVLEQSEVRDNSLSFSLSKMPSHRAENEESEVSDNSPSFSLSKMRSPKNVLEESEVSDNSLSDSYKRPVRDVSVAKLIPGEYVKRLISMYGDAGSMTMNVSGLNAMLRELDLVKMVEGGHAERKPDYVYKSGHEEEVNHTCVNSADLITAVNLRLKPEHDHEHHESHDELNEMSLQALCPIILYQKLANTSHERQGCVVDRERSLSERISSVGNPEAYTTRRIEVWVYSSLSIFAISACGLLGVAVVPIMHKNYYNHIMQFLIALAIGTLGGDAFLHLIPHALSTGHGHGSGEHSHNDGMWKGLAAMLGVVFFYFTEKGLTVIAEFRKRRQKKEENKLPSRVRVLQDEGVSGCSKPVSTNSFLKIFNSKCKKQEDPDTKMCKHKYSEYPYCYDEITTDTHDQHHHRDGQIPPSPKGKKANSVSVVSSNNLSEKESEPTAKDWLLNYMDEEKEGQKDGVEMNNIKHKDGDVSKELKDEESYTVILREHSRAHHGHSHSHGHVHAPPSSLSSVVWMVIMGDGLHNFTDGMAIGAAFASNIAVGFSTAIAVLCHELPHELGDFAVLLKAGMSVRRAIFYNILSSVLCIAGMVCGVLVGHAPSATSWVFAVAAGLFIYIALADLVPELSSSHSKEGTFCQCMLQLLGLCTGIGIMLLIALYEHDLEKLFG